jgi:hypothetical protein
LILEAWCGDDPATIVLRLGRDVVTRESAVELAQGIQDYADDCASTANARLCWRTASGETWASKTFRARPSVSREEGVFPLDGSMSSMLSQNQRHTEAAFQLAAGMVEKSEGRMERMFSYMDRMLERLDQKAERAVAENEELEERALTAEQLAEQALEAADEAVKEAEAVKEDDKLARVIDMGMRAMGGGAA